MFNVVWAQVDIAVAPLNVLIKQILKMTVCKNLNQIIKADVLMIETEMLEKVCDQTDKCRITIYFF